MCLIFMVCIHMSYSLAYHLAHYQYQGVDKITDYDFLVVITLAKKLKNNQRMIRAKLWSPKLIVEAVDSCKCVVK